MSARVLVDAAGRAVLEIRPGTFDNATNTFVGQPSGYIEKVQYKIVGSDGKQISVTNVTVAPTQLFTAVLPAPFNVANIVGLQVSIKDQGGKKGSSTVRGNAATLYNPSVNLAATGIDLHRASPSTTVIHLGGSSTVAVQTDVFARYTVNFINDFVGNTAPAVGIQMNCVVLVDGAAPAPGSLTFTNGPSLFIGPGSSKFCDFNLKISGLGQHTITVRGDAVYPPDYDPSDNSVSAVVTVTKNKPLDTGGAISGAVEENIWYVGPNAGGAVYGVSMQDAAVSRLSTLVVNSTGDLGSFTMTGSLTSGGTLFDAISVTVEHLFANTCERGRVTDPSFVNQAVVIWEICATATVDGLGNQAQAITISYASAVFPILWSAPGTHVLFGNTADFNLTITRSVGGQVVESLEAPISVLISQPFLNLHSGEGLFEGRPGVTRRNAAAG